MGGTVNLRPDTFAEGGGLIDDFDGVIDDIRFIMTDYDGAISNAVCVAQVKYTIDDEEVGTDLLSVGGKDDFAPNETGMGLTKLKTKDTLTKKSKFGMYLEELVAVGFPLNKMDSEDISYLNSFKGHFLRRAVVFEGITKKDDDRKNTVLLCTKVISLPGEGGKSTKGGKGKKTKVDAGLVEDVAGIIAGMVLKVDGGLPKKDLLSALFKDEAVAALSDKRAALKLASDDTFLKSREEWTFEDGVLKM